LALPIVLVLVLVIVLDFPSFGVSALKRSALRIWAWVETSGANRFGKAKLTTSSSHWWL
jgi:hypothetical protein